MSEKSWDRGVAKSFGVFLNGEAIPNPNPQGEPVIDDSFYLIFNAHHEDKIFTLPKLQTNDYWQPVLDTSRGWFGEGQQGSAGNLMKGGLTAGDIVAVGGGLREGSSLKVEARSIVMLQRPRK
jgi:pullulanase/glycogen debranching enzyme